ncbi:MAG: glucuronate isomerase, partial [Burkholderiales bacterium]|nr:glucuronate isomerase [Opitutaceae bacterium]
MPAPASTPVPDAADDALLTTPLARRLFHEVARELPVIDFHNHLDPVALAEDRAFANFTQLCIATDPYKHRALRIAGVPEAEITGPAPDHLKFDHWAATLPLALGNPLHPWSRLELHRYFAIPADLPLSPASAEQIWTTANALLARPTHTARRLLARGQVAVACTSDRLLDDLSAHAALARSGYEVRVLPSLRADDITAIESPGYLAWLAQLAAATGIAVNDYDSFRAAV